MKSIKWYLIAVGITIGLFFFTSLSFYNVLGFFLSLIIAVLAAAFTLLGFLNVGNLNEILFLEEEQKQNVQGFHMMILMVMVIVGSIILSLGFEERLDYAIEKHGVSVKATVVDGFQYTEQRRRGSSTSYSVTIAFPLQNKEERRFGTKIDADIYNSLSKGLKVDIKYLPEDPSIFRIMAGTRNVSRFKHIDNRNIRFSDLEKLRRLGKVKALSFLDSVSAGWTVTEDSGATVCSNPMKNELIAFTPGGDLIFRGNEFFTAEEFIPLKRIIKKGEPVVVQNNKEGLPPKIDIYELDTLSVKYFAEGVQKPGTDNRMVYVERSTIVLSSK